MEILNLKMRLKFILFILIFNSCSYPEIVRDELIYSNDFEDKNLDMIDGGGFSYFNNSLVLGDFNNDGFTLHIENAGNHDYVFVSFDLYIHGSWDGNFNGFSENDKPDKWILQYKPGMDLFNNSDFDKFETTFSNSPCWPNYCLRQSYPETFPFENNPKTGSFQTDLEEKCADSFFGGKTSLYKIEKVFKSSGSSVILRFFDELYQPNAIDKDGKSQQKCDESWSIDNIIVRAVKYK